MEILVSLIDDTTIPLRTFLVKALKTGVSKYLNSQ